MMTKDMITGSPESHNDPGSYEQYEPTSERTEEDLEDQEDRP